VDPDASTTQHLKNAFKSFLAALEDEGEARFFLRDCWAVPALDVAGRREHEAAVSLVRPLIEHGIANGDLANVDPEAAARVILGAFAEATLHILTTGHTEATVMVVERVIDAFAQPPLRTPGDSRSRGAVGGASRARR
jgi:hypothetical protein